ncbi:MarR family winged helix-turn-helix transcriptional regulator [Streptomyces flavofungini]|uniref:MarR family winged helix-turn-helix transcriptional regulator n=1 Tax=Streptomyces flavofungini TaxID=68200 RepID=UPI0025B2363D|nr:MarR family winged helix-turn-helix transcriptional regulator [Streptomyces flavofungini]WJV46613.1 MarR family winged helix-turn-helix transcriptional regulator [Streptomyces flavofungini]
MTNTNANTIAVATATTATTTARTKPPFAPSHSDADLVHQPIGYWSSAAAKAVVHHIRTMLAENGLTQPQWWVLNQLVGHENGRDRKDVVQVLRGYLEFGEGPLEHDIDSLIRRGLLTQAPDVPDAPLRLTDAGEELRNRVAALQERTRAEIHEGIDDADYIQALKVLQRMIHNVDGQAWHH